MREAVRDFVDHAFGCSDAISAVQNGATHHQHIGSGDDRRPRSGDALLIMRGASFQTNAWADELDAMAKKVPTPSATQAADKE